MPQSTFNNVVYTDPRDDLKARTDAAREQGDTYVAIPISLSEALQYRPKYCEARTTVNGDRFTRTLVEVRCTRELDPDTGKHLGWHKNGKNTWE